LVKAVFAATPLLAAVRRWSSTSAWSR
jgi:hypothetical protein